MTVLAPPSATSGDGTVRRPRFALRGLAWLVWREHRGSFRLWMFCGLALTGYLVYWHLQYHATFDNYMGGPNATFGLPPDVGLSAAAALLLVAPFLAAVVFGAQLFARAFTDGTFRLICSQSVSAVAWVRAELAVSAAMLVLCVTPCAAAFTWDFRVDFVAQWHWHGLWMFGAIGPAAVGICLVGLFLGALSGLVWHRGLAARGLALVSLIAFEAGLFQVLPHLLPSAFATSRPGTGGLVYLPAKSWVLGSGPLGSTGQWARFLPYSDLQPLQWTVTAICVAVCAALSAACLRIVRHRRA